jgi:hypothetical protein
VSPFHFWVLAAAVIIKLILRFSHGTRRLQGQWCQPSFLALFADDVTQNPQKGWTKRMNKKDEQKAASVVKNVSRGKKSWVRRRLLESMLWSQFSAIFANFQRKNWRFSQKTNVMIKFLQKSSWSLSKKRQYFRYIFRRKYLKNRNIGPWIDLCVFQSRRK